MRNYYDRASDEWLEAWDKDHPPKPIVKPVKKKEPWVMDMAVELLYGPIFIGIVIIWIWIWMKT